MSLLQNFSFHHCSDICENSRSGGERGNVRNLFDVKGIPSDNRIRNIVDGIAPSAISGVFNDTLKVAQQARLARDPLRGILVLSAAKPEPNASSPCEKLAA
jgi:hypothetical protein